MSTQPPARLLLKPSSSLKIFSGGVHAIFGAAMLLPDYPVSALWSFLLLTLIVVSAIHAHHQEMRKAGQVFAGDNDGILSACGPLVTADYCELDQVVNAGKVVWLRLRHNGKSIALMLVADNAVSVADWRAFHVWLNHYAHKNAVHDS